MRLLPLPILALAAFSCAKEPASAADGSPRKPLRFGHFPNVTHAQGMIAHQLSRLGRGWYEKRLPAGTEIEWYVFNAGPSAMEGFLAGSLDLTYVGPSPALNAYAKSRGEEVRILAGAAYGGSALVVQEDGRIIQPEDFRGKRIATPQLGNTQDVSARAWLAGHGLEITQTGGDAHVIPTSNPDQLALFARGDLDAVWTVEPWVARLEMEAGGKVFLDEPDAITTVLAASSAFVAAEPELAAAVARAHAELTAWIVANPEEAGRLLLDEMLAETTRPMPPELLARCWPRLRFDAAIELGAFEEFVTAARAAGFLTDAPPLDRLIFRP